MTELGDERFVRWCFGGATANEHDARERRKPETAHEDPPLGPEGNLAVRPIEEVGVARSPVA
jgi:hypothetical protein